MVVQAHASLGPAARADRPPVEVIRGVVADVRGNEPIYYHGTTPGALLAILRRGGFKSSGEMDGYSEKELNHIHEWNPSGGKGVYTSADCKTPLIPYVVNVNFKSTEG